MVGNLSKKQWCAIGTVSTAVVVAIAIAITCTHNAPREKNIKITREELDRYREMIGDGMDIKKAIFIIFNEEDECKDFIEKHGNDEHPENAGYGVAPIMEDGYYNIVGKRALEDVFDSLEDGEYAKEPVIYAEKYCYLKRLSIERPTDDDKKLMEIIEKDKNNR